MSDFGFDAYALDGEESGAHPHPLEIARDLIATGKPRSALEVLSMHHDELVDRPEYLLLCSEAWWMDGDLARAQQALLGAARLAPHDPAPLQMLGELLRELGEHDKAERAFAKAQTLHAANAGDDGLDDGMLEPEEDLIAFAERQERSGRTELSLKPILFGIAALLAIAGLVAGIVVLTQPESSSPPELVEEEPPRTEPATAVAAAPSSPTGPDIEQESALQREPEPASASKSASASESASEPASVSEPAEAPVRAPSPPPAPAAKRAPNPKPRTKQAKTREAVPAPADDAPDPALVQRELATLDAAALTRRADTLYARGHTGAAASYYRRALELDPDYAPAMVGIGRSILRAEKYTDAMKNATRALELARGVDARPGLEAEAIYQIARVHLQRGELDAARRLFRQSISLPGTPAAAWFYLGEALWNDNSPAAREAYERYLELVPTGSLADRARRAIR